MHAAAARASQKIRVRSPSSPKQRIRDLCVKFQLCFCLKGLSLHAVFRLTFPFLSNLKQDKKKSRFRLCDFFCSLLFHHFISVLFELFPQSQTNTSSNPSLCCTASASMMAPTTPGVTCMTSFQR